ncbi:MAG: hypothetical protein HFG77_16955, partial [Hungatella sp.]|nr:hypothetical protein [Hungatella sp.]
YLKEGDYDTIAHTVVNGLVIASGMIYDRVVAKGVENTVRNISWIGSRGMKETDQEILNIMTC